MNQFPSLYNITRRKHQTVAEMLSTRPLNVSFRRALVGDRLKSWIQLVTLVLSVNLIETCAKFVWRWNKNNSLTVRSMYLDLMQAANNLGSWVLWKIKVSLKIKKIFLWYLKRGVTLTKDNLIKRNWKGCAKCCFCNSNETIQHLFFECHVASFIWNMIYVLFGIQPPTNVSNLLGSWLIKFSSALRQQILVGASAMC